MKGVLALVAVPVVLPALLLGLLTISDEDTQHQPLGGSGVLDLSAVPEPYRDAVASAATRCPSAVTGPVIAAQIDAESGWNPAETSETGAQGISQFMPETWQEWGTDYSGDGVADVWDPVDAIGSQADYMCYLSEWVAEQTAAGTITGDQLALTLAAYNAGPGAVQRARGLPGIKETSDYVARVVSLIPTYTVAGTHDYNPGEWPAISADGTSRVSTPGSGRLDTSILCQVSWEVPGTYLRCDAAEELAALNAEFVAAFGTSLRCPGANAYRDLATQQQLRAKKGKWAATPGMSNHGWGLAADLNYADAAGALVSPGYGSAQYLWLREHAPAHGWNHPSWARRGGSLEEPWHWEYVRTR